MDKKRAPSAPSTGILDRLSVRVIQHCWHFLDGSNFINATALNTTFKRFRADDKLMLAVGLNELFDPKTKQRCPIRRVGPLTRPCIGCTGREKWGATSRTLFYCTACISREVDLENRLLIVEWKNTPELHAVEGWIAKDIARLRKINWVQRNRMGSYQFKDVQERVRQFLVSSAQDRETKLQVYMESLHGLTTKQVHTLLTRAKNAWHPTRHLPKRFALTLLPRITNAYWNYWDDESSNSNELNWTHLHDSSTCLTQLIVQLVSKAFDQLSFSQLLKCWHEPTYRAKLSIQAAQLVAEHEANPSLLMP